MKIQGGEMMKECIKVERLSKQYGSRMVVDNISFSVSEKEVFGLLGHNGAGKSTTIACMLSLTKPHSGKVEIVGETITKKNKEIFEKVGVQLQHSHFQDHIKVCEICEEMASLYKEPLDYHDLLKQFQLEQYEKQFVDKLSGGEKQKLSLVLALLPNPKVLFLDELTTGLDVAARREVWNILKELKQKGMTLFLTTHYMEEAENLCDRILILKEGKQVVEGTVEEIIARSPYKSLEEAYLWYVGEENLV